MTRAQSDGLGSSAVCELTCSCWHLGALYGSWSIIVVWFGGPQSMTVTDRFGKWYARGAAESLRRAVRAAPIPRAFGQLRNLRQRRVRASSSAQVAVVIWRDDGTRVRPCALSVSAVDSPGR
jgi:hypothetical protein